MDSGTWAAIAASLIGVVGTLSSPVLTQRIGARTRRQEFAYERGRERDRAAREERLRHHEERREHYARLNTALRSFHRALSAHLHILDAGTVTEADRARLDEVRDAYQDVFSVTSLVSPRPVFQATLELDEVLAVLYGMVKRMDGSPASPAVEAVPPQDTVPEARRHLQRAARLSHALRDLMRTDLGVDRATT